MRIDGGVRAEAFCADRRRHVFVRIGGGVCLCGSMEECVRNLFALINGGVRAERFCAYRWGNAPLVARVVY